MNAWLKSILIGLLGAALVFFIYPKTGGQSPKQLFTVHYILEVIPGRQLSGESINGIQVNTVLNMSTLIIRRCKAAGYVADIKDTDKNSILDITIHHVDDTLRPRQLLIKTGKLEIRETYTLPEIPSFLNIGRKEDELNDSIALPPVTTSDDPGKPIKISELSKPKKENPSALDTIIAFSTVISGRANSEIGWVKEKDTAVLNEILRSPGSLRLLPADIKFYYGTPDNISKRKGAKVFYLYAIRMNEEIPFIENKDIQNASYEYDRNGTPQVAFGLNSLGTRKWEIMTRSNIGKYLAIIFDDIVISVPLVNGTVTGGRSTINGGFTVEEAEILAMQLNSGTVPARIKIIKQDTVPESPGNNRKLLLIVTIIFIAGTGLSYFIFNTLKNN